MGENQESRFVGKPGQRLTLELTCVRATISDKGQFGPMTIIKFRDGRGNVFTWFASGVKTDMFEPGIEYVVKATVKKHVEFHDVQETHLNRVVETNQPTLKILG